MKQATHKKAAQNSPTDKKTSNASHVRTENNKKMGSSQQEQTQKKSKLAQEQDEE